MNWISLNDALLIHHLVIEETGGVQGIINPGALESAILRPFTSVDKVEAFPDLYAKAAVLIHGLISSHPFVDGNKRTAFVAADVCLRLNGLRILPSQSASGFFWSVARGEHTWQDIRAWLIKNSEKIADT